MIGVNGQTVLFLRSLLLGAAIGALYDMFRVLRMALPHNTVAVFIEDVLFFGACATATFFFLMSTLYGQVRAFILLGECLGALVYALTASRIVMGFFACLIKAIRWMFRILYRLFVEPLKKMIQWLCGMGGKMAKIGAKRLKKIGCQTKNNLKKRVPMRYNHSIRTYFFNKWGRDAQDVRKQSDGKGEEGA